jgi:NADPH:quinone reductase-like Zn-dependent oxidoreductase
MKALVYRDFGSPDVLRCEEIEKPIPGENEVLIRVRAVGLNPLDWRFMRGGPALIQLLLGGRKPKRMGRDVAGEVEAVGSKVTQFKPADAVFGACRGALAEYVCTRESALALKPSALTFEQAASVPIAGWTALQGLRDKGRIQPGQRVLINGAAGGVGTFAVQIGKYLEADVTGICSTRNVEMVRGIGADHVLDYTVEDFTRGDARYDVILDCVANHSPAEVRHALTPRGKCVLVGAPHDVGLISLLAGLMKLLVMAPFSSQKVATMMAKARQGDLKFLATLMQEGKVTPVIDRCYGFGDTAEAVRYLEEGHARGKVVVTVAA